MTANDSTLLMVKARIRFSPSTILEHRQRVRPGDIGKINDTLPDWITLLQISGGAPVWTGHAMTLRFGVRLEQHRLALYRLSEEIPRLEEIRAVIRDRFQLSSQDELTIRPDRYNLWRDE